MTLPYFSIIVPAYNRATMIGRAIESCLSQTFADFELVVVDDGSTDESAQVAGRYKDSRVKLLRHTMNRGPCPARNTGIRNSSGHWCVMLDSDFSLLPGALENLYQRTQAASSDIGNVASSCLWDTGDVTPLPNVPGHDLDYVGYLEWSDTLTISEYLNCIRREVFEDVLYPDSRAWETSFHLNLAYRWRLRVTRDVVVKIHTDAPNRLTTGSGRWAMERALLEARDKLDDLYVIWERHGEAIKRHAPRRHLGMLREAGRLSFLCGRRKEGLYYMSKYLRRASFDLRAWMIPVFGLMGPRAVAWAATRR